MLSRDATASVLPRRGKGQTVQPLTVLITGFGPFPGARFNPTGALVAALMRRRPAFGGLRLIGHVFRTSYATVDDELPALVAKHRPDVLLMFGLATRTKYLRIESCARNARSPLLADASGALPERRILPAGAAMLRGRAPLARLLGTVRKARVPVRISHNAGRYLCNYLYWRASEMIGPNAPRQVVFVHVPAVRSAPRPRIGSRQRGVGAADLARAGEALLRALVAAAQLR